VAYTYNPSYSGGRDQEDCNLKPAWANSSTRPYLKTPFTEIGLMEWLKVKALSSIPSTAKEKKKSQAGPGPWTIDPTNCPLLFREQHKVLMQTYWAEMEASLWFISCHCFLSSEND
jgi:hypothetical protein